MESFDEPVKSDIRTYDNVQKIATGQGDGFITGCLLDYNYFNNYYKIIITDLSKQQELDARKSRSRRRCNNVFHYWGSKRKRFSFSTRDCESIVNVFHNFILF